MRLRPSQSPLGRKVQEEKGRHYRLIKVDAICKDLIAVEFRMHCVFASSERAAAASCGLCAAVDCYHINFRNVLCSSEWLGCRPRTFRCSFDDIALNAMGTGILQICLLPSCGYSPTLPTLLGWKKGAFGLNNAPMNAPLPAREDRL